MLRRPRPHPSQQALCRVWELKNLSKPDIDAVPRYDVLVNVGVPEPTAHLWGLPKALSP